MKIPKRKMSIFYLILYGTLSLLADTKEVEVFSHNYEKITNFSDGLAAVLKDGKWGFINKTGELVIPFIVNDSEGNSYGPHFNEGIACVEVNNKYGYINERGEFILPAIYEEAKSFSEGIAAVKKDGKWGYIDKTGKYIIEPSNIDLKFSLDPFILETIHTFSEGLVFYKMGDKWGFKDKNGKTVIQPQFDDTWDFKGNYATVKKDGKWGLIDKKGNYKIKPKYDFLGSFEEGLAEVKKDGKHGFINIDEEIVIPLVFEDVTSFSEGVALAQDKGKWGLIDKSGTFIVPPKYDSQKGVSQGVATVGKKSWNSTYADKWGYIDRNGNEIVELKYGFADPYEDGMARVNSKILLIFNSTQDSKNDVLTNNNTLFAENKVPSEIKKKEKGGISSKNIKNSDKKNKNDDKKAITLNYSSSGSHTAKAAYLTGDILCLVEIIEKGGQESEKASQYLAISNLQDLSYKDLVFIYKKLPKTNKIATLVGSLLKYEEIEVLEELENYGGNDLMALLKTHPEYENILEQYVLSLNEGLDSISYNEARYLHHNVPVFNKERLSTISKNKHYQIEKRLNEHVQEFVSLESLATDLFLATLKYEIFEGLLEQFIKLAEAYSYDQDIETINSSAIYSSFINLMSNFWNEELVYQYVNTQVDKFSKSINDARKIYLSNLDMSNNQNFIITIPTNKIDFSGGIDHSDFYWISELREDLSDSKMGSYIVSGLFNLLTGTNFLGNLGESLYNSTKGAEEAKKEVYYRKNVLNKAYETMIERTLKSFDAINKNIKDQQLKQSKDFKDYVIKNY